MNKVENNKPNPNYVPPPSVKLVNKYEDGFIVGGTLEKGAFINNEGLYLLKDGKKFSIETLLNKTPNIDIVPVVRCRDCIHTKTDCADDPAIYCEKWDRWETPPDFFCGYGKHKDLDNIF